MKTKYTMQWTITKNYMSKNQYGTTSNNIWREDISVEKY